MFPLGLRAVSKKHNSPEEDMSIKFGLKMLVAIILALGISGWMSSLSLASAVPVDGNWSGYTHLGKPVSFIVQSGGTQWANFSLTIQITFPSSCTVTMTQTVNGPGAIAGGQFSFTGTNFAFTGQFSSDLTASGTYAFTNQPSACGTFTHSGTWSANTPLPAPGAFSKTNPPDGATNQSVNAGGIGWTASSYAYHYEYCIDQIDNNDCDTGWVNNSYLTSVGLSGLDTNTTYYWQARALNSNGTTYANEGDWYSFTTGVPPVNFNKAGPGNGGITNTTVTFSWEPSSTAASYEICIDPINNQSCDANWISSGAQTFRTLSGLNNHITYYWQVRAFNSGGYTDANNGVWWSFTTLDPPGLFGKELPPYQSSNQSTSPTLKWSASSEVDYYEYCYDTSINEQCDGEWLDAGPNTSVVISGLNTNTTYYWQVRAVNLGGTTYPAFDGGWWMFTTAPPRPGSFAKIGPQNGSQNQPPWPTLSWSASAGADYYKYCIDTTDNDQCDAAWSDDTYQTSVQLNSLTANTTYYWQVQAFNGGGVTEADDQAWRSFKTDIPQAGPTYLVNSTSGGKDGLCGSGHCTLRDALSASETDGVASSIQLQPATIYTLIEADNTPLYAAANGLPVINTTITIFGNGSTLQRSQGTGMPEFRFFKIADTGNLTLENLTLTKGAVALSSHESIGGAIYNSGQLTIHNNIFLDNSANAAGAIMNFGTAAITDTLFNQNHAIARGTCGSAAISNGGVLTIADSQFTDNTSSGAELCAAGAIDHNGASLAITNSTFSGHTTPNWAVIEISFDKSATITNSTFRDNSTSPIVIRQGGSLQIASSTFSNNIAYLSGGIYVASGSLSVANSTFWNNTAFSGSDYFSGGGINASGSVVEVTNSTFANNSASEGAAIFSAYTTFTVKNSIFADSAHGENCGGYGSTPTPIIDGGHNLDAGSTCNFSAANHSLSNTNPLLGVLQNNSGPTQTMALLPGSPAIDTGANAVCQADPVNNLDQRGAPRPVDGDKNGSAICDMGAYESPAWSLPGALTKVSPPNEAQAQPVATILSWGPSMDAESYAYCVDTTDNGQCDTSWVGTGSNMFVGLNNLKYATTYYWQARATNSNGTIQANQNTWWSFTTIPNPPAAFNKSAPANGATNQLLNPTLSWQASIGAVGYEFCYDTTNDNACTSWINNGAATVKTLNGLEYNTRYYWHVRACNPSGVTYSNSFFWSFKTKAYPVSFLSVAANDGWILESTETINVGGTMNFIATTLHLGDDAARKQYRSILSFGTGSTLPDTAIITKVTLKLRQQGIVGGGNPVTAFQGFMADIRKGTFGTSALQVTDWQATANKTYGPFTPALTGGWYTFNLTSAKAYINKLAAGSGLTQIRLRFKLDDNNNAIANYLSLYSGNAGAASRPQLIVEYYIP